MADSFPIKISTEIQIIIWHLACKALFRRIPSAAPHN